MAYVPSRYYTRKGQVPLSEGDRLQFTKGKGYYRLPWTPGTKIPVPGDPLAPWGPKLIEQELEARLAAITKPMQEQYRLARETASRQNQADLAAAQAAYSALASMMGSGGANMSAIYGNATQSNAALGESMRAAGEGRLSGAAAEASADVLRNNPTADVSQIQGGYAPAAAMGAAHAIGTKYPNEGLSAEGAARTTEARLQPDFAVLKGMEYIRAQNAEYMESLRDLDDSLQEQMAKLPEIRMQIADTMRDYEMDKLATRANLEALGLRAQGQAWDQQQDVIRNKKDQQRLANERRRIDLQEKRFKNDLAKAAASGTKPNVTLSKAMGWLVDDWGKPILRNGKKVLVPKEVKAQAPEQKTKDRNKALGDRNQAVNTTVARAEDFLRDSVMMEGVLKPEYLDGRGKPKYSMIRARIMARFWTEVQGFATAQGKKALRAEFSRRIDAMLRANGISPSPRRR